MVSQYLDINYSELAFFSMFCIYRPKTFNQAADHISLAIYTHWRMKKN